MYFTDTLTLTLPLPLWHVAPASLPLRHVAPASSLPFDCLFVMWLLLWLMTEFRFLGAHRAALADEAQRAAIAEEAR